MSKLLLSLLFLSTNIVFGQLNRSLSMDDLKRDDGMIYVWIYFKDKPEMVTKVSISKKTLARRSRNLSEKDLNWYDVSPSKSYITQITGTGAKLRGESRWFNAVSIECNEEQLDQIVLLPFVKDVQPIRQYRKQKTTSTQFDRTLGKSLVAENLNYGQSVHQIEQINVHQAHENGYSGKGISILVLDSGYNTNHPVFDSLQVIAEWDVINDDSTTRNEDGQDIGTQQSHGTSVLSIMGGYAPETLIGPAYKAGYILAKTEDLTQEAPIEEDHFVRAMEWGEALGADIVSTSVGYVDWYTREDMDGHTALITKAYVKAAELGILCIASAGNENYSWNPWKIVTPPADADSIIAVGSVKIDGKISAFSSIGPTADGRRKPEVCALGDSTWQAAGNFTYRWGDGTSFAAPLVAGAAALVMEAHPNWPAMAVRDAILKSASQSNSPNNTYGWGIMDTWAAIKSDGGDVLKAELEQNFPNPMGDFTKIEYLLKQSARVKLEVYNILGNEIITLVDKFEASGEKSVIWDGKDMNGKRVSNGVYIYSLIIGDKHTTNKLVVIN